MNKKFIYNKNKTAIKKLMKLAEPEKICDQIKYATLFFDVEYIDDELVFIIDQYYYEDYGKTAEEFIEIEMLNSKIYFNIANVIYNITDKIEQVSNELTEEKLTLAIKQEFKDFNDIILTSQSEVDNMIEEKQRTLEKEFEEKRGDDVRINMNMTTELIPRSKYWITLDDLKKRLNRLKPIKWVIIDKNLTIHYKNTNKYDILYGEAWRIDTIKDLVEG